MTKLSVNINKIATLRNSRGGDIPNVVEAALNAERFGAQGITVHPRPDQRHIRYQDVRDLKQVITTELNMEGNPIDSFIDLALEVLPAQVTLVPDAHDALTSNSGWDTKAHQKFLSEVIATFKYGLGVNGGHDLSLENLHYFARTIPNLLEVSIGHALISDAIYLGLENTIQLYLRQLKE